MEIRGSGRKPVARKGHSLNFLESRQTFIVFGGISNAGGVIGRGELFNDVHSFDILTETWTEVTTHGVPPEPRFQHASVVVDNALYIFGGKSRKTDSVGDAYKLCLNTWMWSKVVGTGISMVLSQPLWACVKNTIGSVGEVIVFGGIKGKARPGRKEGVLNFHKLNVLTGEYASPLPRGHAPSPRHAYSVVVWKGRAVLFGGYDGHERFNQVHVLNIMSGEWELVKTRNTPTARYGHSAVLVENYMFVVGGYHVGWTNDVHILNLNTMSWCSPMESAGATLPPRESHTACAVGRRLLVFGGCCWPVCRNDLYAMEVVDLLHTMERTVLEDVGYGTGKLVRGHGQARKRQAKERKQRELTLRKKGSSSLSSKSDSQTLLDSDYVFTGTSGEEYNTTRNGATILKGMEMVKFSTPPIDSPPLRTKSPRQRTGSLSLSPSYRAAKKVLRSGTGFERHSYTHDEAGQESTGDHPIRRSTHDGVHRNASAESPLVSLAGHERGRRLAPGSNLFPRISTKAGDHGTFLTEVSGSPSPYVVHVRQSFSSDQDSGTPSSTRSTSQRNIKQLDASIKQKEAEALEKRSVSHQLDRELQVLEDPVLETKRLLDEEKRDAIREKEIFLLKKADESETLRLSQLKEQEAKADAAQMLQKLTAAEAAFKEVEQRVVKERGVKENLRLLGQKATKMIDKLKDDLDALSASGDQLEKEDQQITSDIKMLRLLIAQEAAKKAEMQKQLESLQKQRRDAEDKIAEQIKEIAQLDEDLNLLHGNALLVKRMETDYAQAYERESGGGMT